MIEIFEGRIGGGKTYHAVKRIASLLSQGLTVATDIEVKWEGLCAYVADEWMVEIQPQQFISLAGISVKEFHRITPKGEPGAPVTVILDEAHLNFNSRDWNQTSRELLAFLTQSRKQYTDIIFISQSIQNIDKQFRVLMQFVWRFKDLTRFTVPGLGISFATLIQIITFGICRGDWMVATRFDYDGVTYQERQFSRRDTRVFNSYNTDALLSDFQRAGTAKKVMVKKASSEKAMVLRVIMICILIMGGGAYWVWKTRKQEKQEAERRELSKPVAEVVHERPTFRSSPVEPRYESPAARLGQATERDVRQALAAYDVYAENFKSYSGQGERMLKTSSGSYREGAMSQRGFVVAVRDREARIIQPNGRTGWIVAEDVAGPIELPREVGKPSLPPMESIAPASVGDGVPLSSVLNVNQ